MTTNEIFKTMVDWIVDNTEMRNPTEALRKAGLNTTNYSKIKSGTNKSVKYETMRKLNNAFGKPFNPEWMRGRSNVMLTADVAPLCSGKQEEPAATDWASVALAAKDDIIAEKDARIADLHNQLNGKDDIIAAKDSQLADRARIIAANEALIKNLQQQLDELRAKVAIEKGLSTGRSLSESAESHFTPVP